MVKIIILFGSFIFLELAKAQETVIVSPKPLPNATPIPIDESKVKSRKSKFYDEIGTRPEYLISSIYRNGEHLIYDCKKRHFACVNIDSFKFCKQKREEGFILRHKFLRCVPLKKFKSQTECYKKQLDLIGRIPNKKFCLNSDRKLLN